MIFENKLFFSIQLMCCVLSVSTSGYYDWVNRPESVGAQLNAKLKADIGLVFEDEKSSIGSPRVHKRLQKHRCLIISMCIIIAKDFIRPLAF
jgi:hypothetical protein